MEWLWLLAVILAVTAATGVILPLAFSFGLTVAEGLGFKELRYRWWIQTLAKVVIRSVERQVPCRRTRGFARASVVGEADRAIYS